jgi:hypothetical protein
MYGGVFATTNFRTWYESTVIYSLIHSPLLIIGSQLKEEKKKNTLALKPARRPLTRATWVDLGPFL